MSTFHSIGVIGKPMTGCASHRHDIWEFVLYLEGTGAITVGDVPVPFRPGTIVCLPPRIPHFERSDAGYRNYHLCFTDFVPPASGIPTCRDDEHGTFAGLCALLHRESRLGAPRWRPVCQHLGQALIELIERWCGNAGDGSVVERLKAALYAGHADAEFGVADALRAVPCAPDHARRLFRAATGRTPLDWLTELRVGEAQHLLASGAGVAEAAARVGFADPSYFTRVFTRATGHGPRAWAAAIARGERPAGGGWT